MFFVTENELITAPADKVLVGITRQKTIQLAQELHIGVVEKEVKLSELKSFYCSFFNRYFTKNSSHFKN